MSRSHSRTQSPARKRAHACDRVWATLPGLPGGGLEGGARRPARPVAAGRVPASGSRAAREARDREIRTLLETALKRLQEGP